MKKQILKYSTLLAIFAISQAQPIGVGEADVNNIWETTSVQTWPWSLSPTAPHMNPAYFNSNYLVSHPRFIEPRLPLRITPTYFVSLSAPSTSYSQFNGEVSAQLINKGKGKIKKKMEEKSKTAASSKSSTRRTVNNANEKIGDFKSDEKLLKAIQSINPEFVIEDILPVPGQYIFSTIPSEKLSNTLMHSAGSNVPLYPALTESVKISSLKKMYKRKPQIPKSSSPEVETPDNEVRVEAIGRTATSGTIPQIPFGTFFLPYFAKGQQDTTNTAALILEPHSKAVVGNGGTAVSTPISKAFLKRGVPTNVYFNPESVAIAGVGGKAHAQADLELDLVD